MSPQPQTVGERLVHIETLLENIASQLVDMKAQIETIEAKHQSHNEDYQKLKNRAWGLLMGVSLIAGAVGAGLRDFFS
jgi:chromosome segregation ATPase